MAAPQKDIHLYLILYKISDRDHVTRRKHIFAESPEQAVEKFRQAHKNAIILGITEKR